MTRKLMTLAILALFAFGAAAGTVYVDASAAGDGSGNDWSNACTTLADAVAKATGEGDEIHVKGDLSQTAAVTIASHAGLAIRGGYTGVGEARDGRSRLVRDTTAGNFRIVDVSASTVTFDGLSIEQGHEHVNGEMGHGVKGTGASSLTFTNCCFASNGGFFANSWTVRGAAIGATDGSLTVVDCAFLANEMHHNDHLYSYGGAIYAKNESVRIVNSSFKDNYADAHWDCKGMGGAIYLESCASPVVDGVAFTNNYVTKVQRTGTAIGGTMMLKSCTGATIRDCRVIGGWIAFSQAPDSTQKYNPNGLAFRFEDSTVSLSRTVLLNIGNNKGFCAGAIDVVGSTSRLSMTNVLVSGVTEGWALGNNNGTIEAVNCTFTGVTNADASRYYPGYVQNGGTASFRNCIFWNLKDGRSYVYAGATAPTFEDCTDVTDDPLFGDTTYCHPMSAAGRYDGGWFDGGAWVTTDTETSTNTIDRAAGLVASLAEPQPNGNHVNCGYDGNAETASKSVLDDEPVVGAALKVLSYPDYALQDLTHVAVYGTLASAGDDASATVKLAWGNADCGETLGNWQHVEECGSRAPWELVTAVMANPSGTIYYRFYAQNPSTQVDWSSPARTLETPGKASLEYASPTVTHLYRASAKVNANLTSRGSLDSYVFVAYWSASDPSVTNVVWANGGKAVAVGATDVDLAGLAAGTAYGFYAAVSNAAGVATLANRAFTTVADDQAMTLFVATAAAGRGDGSSWANAAAIEDAWAQATGEGDEIRLLAGTYSLGAGLVLANRSRFILRGGYTGEGETREGRSVLERGATCDPCQVVDVSASTVLFDGVTIRNGKLAIKGGVYGQGVRIFNGSDATFTNCLFTANTADGDNVSYCGGGLGQSGGALTIVDCDFVANGFSGGTLYGRGGGAYAGNATVTVRNSRFSRNYSTSGWNSGTAQYGGALALESCPTALVEGCTFMTNWVSRADNFPRTGGGFGGGALALISCPDAAVRDCRFIGGGAKMTVSGGDTGASAQIGIGHGVYSGASTVALTRCVFYGVGSYGYADSGAIDVYGGAMYLTNVLVTAMDKGWAIGNANGGAVTAVNCTFNNLFKSAASARQHVAYSQYSTKDTASFTNCIFWDLTNGVACVVDGADPTFANCTDLETDPLFGDAVYCHPMSRAGRYAGGWFSGGEWVTTDTETSTNTIDAVADFAANDEPQPNGRHVNLGYDGNTEVASKSDLGSTPVVTGDALQVFAYADWDMPNETDVRVYGDVAATGSSESSASVYLVWGDSDAGTDKTAWAHTVPCGTHAPWDLVQGTIVGGAGRVYYRFYAVNAEEETAWTDPVRSFKMADKPVLAYATPILTHHYRTSARIHLTLVSNDGLDATVSVTYWPTATPAQKASAFANGGAAVPLGATYVDLADLTPGVEYTYRGEATSMKGTTTIEERTFTTVSEAEELTLDVATAAQGAGDGSSWADATTLAAALAQATGDGDRVRLLQGTYKQEETIVLSNRSDLVIAGGYTGDGETRSGRSLLQRSEVFGNFRLMSVHASTVTVSGVSFEKGFEYVNGAIGHAVRAVDASSVTFTNCCFASNGGFFGNFWDVRGAAIGATDGALRVTDCEFRSNVMYQNDHLNSYGGAIYAKNESVRIVNSSFKDNYADAHWDCTAKGGAICLMNCASPVVAGCAFTNNYVTKVQNNGNAVGGTLYLSACSGAIVRGCEVNGSWINYSQAHTAAQRYNMNGSAFLFENSSVSLLDTAFFNVGKSGLSEWGVVDISGGSLGITNVLIAGATRCWGVGSKGGAVAAANCTIANIVTNGGDRTYAAYVQNTSGAATFLNTIYWDVPGGVVYKTGGNDVTNNYCAAATALEGKKNVVLAESPFAKDDSTFASIDPQSQPYSLRKGSPCVNAGGCSRQLRALTDLVGNPRVQGGKVDLGAYESDSYRGFLLLVK